MALDINKYNTYLADATAALKQMNTDANTNQSVTDKDSRFAQIAADIQVLQSMDGVDQATKDKLTNMSNDLSNLQQLAKGTSSNDTTNSSWQQLTSQINNLVASMPFNGAGSDPLGMAGISKTASQLNGVSGSGAGQAYKYLTLDQAKAAGLPDNVAALQQNQQVNKILRPDGSYFYATSSNDSPPKYSTFLADGTPVMVDVTTSGTNIVGTATVDEDHLLTLPAGGIAYSEIVPNKKS